MNTLTHEPATEGQIKSIVRVGQDAAEKAVREYFAANPTTKENAQRGHARGDQLATAIRTAVQSWLADTVVSDKYKDEEVESSYGYLSGYSKPKSAADQLKILREYFPKLPKGDLVPLDNVTGAEGIFVIPHWSLVAKTYPEAVQKIIDALTKQRGGKFYNYRDGEIDADHIRETTQKIVAMQQLRRVQKSDLLQVPAQFGIRHRGRSVRRVREIFAVSEFGLGAWEIGCMLLTHPERLADYDDLWIDCPGDEWKPSDESEFSGAPFWRFGDGELGFDAYWVDFASAYYGAASGFLPQ